MADGERRFFIDENLLGIARLLAKVRDDIVHPGHPDLPEIPLRTPDLTWLPIVGERRWPVVMRDKRIRTRRPERDALVKASVRAFCLTTAGNSRSWDLLRVIVRNWEAIEVKAKEDGPFIYGVTMQGLSHSPLA